MLEKTLVKKVGIYFIGMLSSKILTVLLIPIYAFYIAVEDLGYYDYIQTIMGAIIPIVYIAIWEAILKFVLSEDNREQKHSIIGTSAIFSIFATIVLVLIALVYLLIFDKEKNLITIFLIITMISTYGIANIWQYYARALNNNKVYTIAGVCGALINFLFILILICRVKLGLNGLILSYILGQISIIIFIEKNIMIRKSIRIKNFKFYILKKMLIFSTPLVANLASMWAMSAFGRIIITNNLGTEANGMFSYANKFSLVVTMIGSVVTMAIIEEAIITAKTKGLDENFSKTIEEIYRIFQCIALIATPTITIFYNIISTTDYYRSKVYAPWLLLYAVTTTMSSNVGSIFQVINKTKYQFITTIIGAGITICSSWALVTRFGIYAIIIGQILGSVTMLWTRYIIINKFVKFKITWLPIIGMTILFILITPLSLVTNVFINFVILILMLICVLIINKKYIIRLFNVAKKKI